MSENYLWDKSGEPDSEIERLEAVLGRLRYEPPESPPAFQSVRRFRPWQASRVRFGAIAAAIAIFLAAAWFVRKDTGANWEVASLAGHPKIGGSRIGASARLRVGSWLETDAGSKANLSVGEIGEVEVGPNTRLRLVRSRGTDYRMAIDRGSINATIWAPPRQFKVDIPSAVAVDLGCAYRLEVDDAGNGLIHVTAGWVSFESKGRESFIPATAACRTQRQTGIGTPYYLDSSESFQAALDVFDADARNEKALATVIEKARTRDGVTLWHLLTRVSADRRERVFDRLAELVPPPNGVTRDAVLRGDRAALDRWWDALGLGDTSWWRLWKGPVPPQR